MPWWKNIETSLQCDTCHRHAKVSSLDFTYAVPELAKFMVKHVRQHGASVHFSWDQELKPLAQAAGDLLASKR